MSQPELRQIHSSTKDSDDTDTSQHNDENQGPSAGFVSFSQPTIPENMLLSQLPCTQGSSQVCGTLITVHENM